MEGPLKAALDALSRVLEQDLEPDPGGGGRIKQGEAKDRMPSLGDKEMRHWRKSKAKTFNAINGMSSAWPGPTSLRVLWSIPPTHRSTRHSLRSSRMLGATARSKRS